MEREGLKNTLYLYLCFYLWVILERVWYLGLRHVSLSQRGSEHAAESLKRRETKAPREILPARSPYFVFVKAVFRIWVGVFFVLLRVCLYFWGLFAPHTSQVLEAGEIWEGALLHKARRCLNEVPPARAADNARCGLVRLRRTTMQSKILDSARQKWRQSGKLRWWISWESEKANGLVFWLFSL